MTGIIISRSDACIAKSHITQLRAKRCSILKPENRFYETPNAALIVCERDTKRTATKMRKSVVIVLESIISQFAAVTLFPRTTRSIALRTRTPKGQRKIRILLQTMFAPLLRLHGRERAVYCCKPPEQSLRVGQSQLLHVFCLTPEVNGPTSGILFKGN